MNNLLAAQVKNLAANIVAGHHKHSGETPPDAGVLPNRDEIIQIIGMFREVLFPAYFGKQNLAHTALEQHLGDLLRNIFARLHTQIACVLKQPAAANNNDPADTGDQAASICCAFLSKIPQIMDYLATDVQAALDGDPAAADKDEIIISYPGIFAISVYRLAHELYLLSVPLIPRIMTEYAHSRTGIDIHAGARIGRYFFIDHGTGVVIGETTVIGDYVTIYQGVTIGALSTRSGRQLRGVKRHPTIEDRVTVYAGASLLGGQTVIGAGSVIGSNVFITQSVPSWTKVSLKNQELLFQGRPPHHLTQNFSG